MYLEEFIYKMNNEGRKTISDINEESDCIGDDVKIYIRHNAQVKENEFQEFVKKYERRLKKIIS